MKPLSEMRLEDLADLYESSTGDTRESVWYELRRRQRMLDAAEEMHKTIDRWRELNGFRTSATMSAYFDYKAAKRSRS